MKKEITGIEDLQKGQMREYSELEIIRADTYSIDLQIFDYQEDFYFENAVKQKRIIFQ